jgi:hypothetical protein
MLSSSSASSSFKNDFRNRTRRPGLVSGARKIRDPAAETQDLCVRWLLVSLSASIARPGA